MSDRPVDIKLDLHNVVNAVKDVVTEWFNLGLNLDLPETTLRLIGSNHQRDAESCLRTMMSKWLRVDIQASWEKLANALTAMGENVIAANIKSKFVTAVTLPVAEISDNDKTCQEMAQTVLQKIKRQFAHLQVEVRSAMETCQVKLDDVHQFLVSFFQSECSIPEASNLTKLFNIITEAKLWRYDHYGPLKQLAETFLPDDNPTRKLVNEYKNQLSGFYTTTKIIDFIDLSELDDSEDDTQQIFLPEEYKKHYHELRVTLKLDRKVKLTDMTMNYVDTLWKALIDEFNLPPLTAIIKKIIGGSLVIMWLIPPQVSTVIKASHSKALRFYQEHNIVKVELDYDILYEEEWTEDISNTALIKAYQSRPTDAANVPPDCSENVDAEHHKLPSIGAESSITVEYVCNVCLSANPSIRDLIDVGCFKPGAHAKAPRLPVRWNHDTGRIERVRSLEFSSDAFFRYLFPPKLDARVNIRPMPHIMNISQGESTFIMCDFGWSCGGDQCMFAHSVEERDAWNEELLRQQYNEKIGAPQTGHQDTAVSQPSRVILSSCSSESAFYEDTQYCHSTRPSVIVTPSLGPLYDTAVMHSHQTPESNLDHHGATADTSASATGSQLIGVESVDYINQKYHQHQQPYDHHQQSKVYDHRHQNYEPSVLPQPQVLDTESTDSTHYSQARSHIHQLIGSQMQHYQTPTSDTTHAPSLPKDSWPSIDSPTTTPTDFPLRSQFQFVKQQLSESSVANPVMQTRSTSQYEPGDVIYETLTASNYKNKFQELLKCEESTHKSILENRCNGEYELVLHQSGLKQPNWMTRESVFRHVRYGYIALNSDQIAYAVCSAENKEGVTLTYNGETICTADILLENYSHIEEKLYIGFDQDAVTKLNHSECPVMPGPSVFNVHVSFTLKHSYFNNLRKSLDSLSSDIIQKLMPNYQSFQSHQPDLQMGTHPMYEPYKKICSPDQLRALKAITLCPSSGPPVLIAGPFGTGKTRILAIAVQFLFEQPTSSCVRVLVCTQQRVSADYFFKTFLNLQQARNVSFANIFLLRSYGYHNPILKKYYKNVQELKHHISRHPDPHQMLIVTTCLTAPRLAYFLQQGFFTHIFIDEGAQIREPEAAAPFCLTDSNTMIVIAGDHHQVGPAMLVLGSKARDNGLDKSLLERLLLYYQGMDDIASNHIVILVTNYRCHPDILELSGNLFYETPLKLPLDKAPPKLHPDYPTSFLFVCSSYSEKVEETNRNTNEGEAIVILEKLKELSEKWPHTEWGDMELSNGCIMSPNRSQLTVISKLIGDRQRGYSRLKSIKRLPTYDIQGLEFRFLFLSTSEPTTIDGYIKNPTKSLCDPFVFNTAITRAQSLIVSIGNPFVLLEVEKLMIMRYGEKGKCWSTYLDYCLRHKTISFGDSLKLSSTEQTKILSKLQKVVKERLLCEPMTPESGDKNVYADVDEFSPPLPTPVPARKVKRSETVISSEDTMSCVLVPCTSSGSCFELEEEITRNALSRFEEEFTVREILGQGGFGVVFHVKSKLDHGDYALKLIRLPANKTEQLKVLREVRALAKLENHPHVVRYNTSWKERAPVDWKTRAYWTELRESSTVSLSSWSPVPVLQSRPATDSSSHTSPSSANTPSDGTVQTVGAIDAENTDKDSSSFTVEFKDSQSNRNNTEESNQVEHKGQTKSCLPPAKTGEHQLLDPPMVLVIQTELCEKKTLKKWLSDHIHDRKRRTVVNFFEQILDALCFIHQPREKIRFVHRDLKPSNIFFARGREEFLKIGDFGLVKGNVLTEPTTQTPLLDVSARQQQSHSSIAGTLLYMSPELREGRGCDHKADIYALGVIFFELNHPFTTDSERFEVLSQLREGKFPKGFRDKLPNEVTLIIQLLMNRNPIKRPSAEEIKTDKHNELKRLRKKVGKKSKPTLVPVLD